LPALNIKQFNLAGLPQWKHAEEAGKRLIEKNFKRVYSIRQGFEGNLNNKRQRSTIGGWRFDGLPLEQC
jgi:hypothetical protein